MLTIESIKKDINTSGYADKEEILNYLEGDMLMREKLCILFFVLSIVLASIQFFYQVDGTIGYLLVVFAVWSMIASIVLGRKVKEFFITFAKFFL